MKKALFILLFINTSILAQYKLILFSYDHSWIPGWSPHTFAHFYDEDSTGKLTNGFSISWLPESGPSDVKVFGDSVKGKSYSLIETFKFAKSNHKKIMMTPVYDIKEELYKAAKKHLNELNSGNIEYKVTSVSRKSPITYHCVYAISDIIKKPVLMNNGFSHTKSSMKKIKDHFKNYIIASHPVTQNTLLFLEIDKYKIVNVEK